jgi:hypothetical protein
MLNPKLGVSQNRDIQYRTCYGYNYLAKRHNVRRAFKTPTQFLEALYFNLKGKMYEILKFEFFAIYCTSTYVSTYCTFIPKTVHCTVHQLMFTKMLKISLLSLRVVRPILSA